MLSVTANVNLAIEQKQTLVSVEDLCQLFNLCSSKKRLLSLYTDIILGDKPHRYRASIFDYKLSDDLSNYCAVELNKLVSPNDNCNYIPDINISFSTTGIGFLKEKRQEINGLNFEVEGHPVGDLLCIDFARVNGEDYSSNWYEFVNKVNELKGDLPRTKWWEKELMSWKRLLS